MTQPETRMFLGRSLRSMATLGALAAALFWLPAAQAALDPFASFHTEYALERGSTSIGEGAIELQPATTEGCHVMEQRATPRRLLRWLTGGVVERSEFCVQPDGTIRARNYKYYRDGFKSEKENFAAAFDWDAGTATYDDGRTVEIESGLLDKLSLQAAIRAWIIASVNNNGRFPADTLKVTFLDKDKIDSYEFKVATQARITVPAGTFATVRVDRVDREDRRAEVWLSPEHGYIVVKAEQQKNDDPTVRLELNKVVSTGLATP